MPNELVPADPQFQSQEPSSAPPPQPSGVSEIFLGPNGIRAGWRLLIFCAIFVGIAFILQSILSRIPYIHDHFGPAAATNEITPGIAMFGEGLQFACLLAVAAIMSLIEKKSFGGYGLPGSEFFGKKFWLGVPYGFAMLSLLLVGIAALHGITLGSVSLTTPAAFRYGLLWAIVFIFVALFEDLSFRGYLQSTLGSGIGF
jgi:membrane protease YdiL (CAAX protease family)